MAHRWGRRGIVLLLAALAPHPTSALEAAPRAWSIELRGPVDDLAGAPEPGSRWVEDGSGNSYLLVRTESIDFGGDLLAASVDASGVLRWQRFLGRDLDLPDHYGQLALQLDGGATVFATATYATYDAFVIAAYDSEGALAWSRRREVEPPDFTLNLRGLTGGADAGIFAFLELRYGFSDPEVHHRLLQYDLEGELVLERELTEDLAVRTTSGRYLGTAGDRNYFLESSISGAKSLVARARADASEIWRSRVFDEPGRAASILTAASAGDGTIAVLGIGADWQGVPAATVAPGAEPIFGPDPWEMFAVAKVDAAGQRVAVRYEALPRGRDLDARDLATSPDGAVFVGAIQDLGSRSEPRRPVLFAYDGALLPRWRQAAWAGESGSAVAVAALADGGAVLAAPQCEGEQCRLFLARLSRGGAVRWSTLAAPCAHRSSDWLPPWIQLGASGGAVRWLVAGPESWEGGPLSFASHSADGSLEWSGGLRAERALALDHAQGLAPLAGGELVLAARSGEHDLFVVIDAEGDVTAQHPLAGIRQSRIRSAPDGGVLVAGAGSLDPEPVPWRPDFVVARFGGADLTELWREYGRPPGGTADVVDDLSVGNDRVCLAGSSSTQAESFGSESRVHCWSLEGEPLWSSRVDGPGAAYFSSSLAISDSGVVAVASRAFSYDALDLVAFDRDGETLWSLRDGAPFEESGDLDLRAFGFTSEGDLILVARAYGSADRTGVFAFDPRGNLRWSWDPLPVAWGPLTASGFAEVDGKVLVAGCLQPWYGGAQEPFVAALAAADGALEWLTALPGPVDCYWLRLATDGCGEPILVAPVHSTPPGGGVAVLSSAGEIRWIDRLEGARALLPMGVESDARGGSWVAWSPGLGEDSVFVTRYQRACSPAP